MLNGYPALMLSGNNHRAPNTHRITVVDVETFLLKGFNNFSFIQKSKVRLQYSKCVKNMHQLFVAIH
jgi:hypothetical protein